MSQPFIGEIRMFGGNFAPAGWAFCDGSLVSIQDNETLFNLIGTTYGGNGTTNFALPDLRGRIPLHMGSGSGLTPRVLAQVGGTETVTLLTAQLPAHNHVAQGSSNNGSQNGPGNGVWAASNLNQFAAGTPNAVMNAQALANGGGNQPHDNVMPFLAVSFIISLFGIYPSQT
jgi:microcystin-dependent protein